MSIHDFYSKLVSQNENVLFSALRRLSLLPDPKCLVGEEEVEPSFGGWIPWEGCETGTCQHAAGHA